MYSSSPDYSPLFLLPNSRHFVLVARNMNAQGKSMEEALFYLSLNDINVIRAFREQEKHTDYNFVFANRDISHLSLVLVESQLKILYERLLDIATLGRVDVTQQPIYEKEGSWLATKGKRIF